MSMNRLVKRYQASPTTQEARGLPSLTVWNGMGSRGYHRPPPFNYPSLQLAFILLSASVIFMGVLNPVEGFNLRSKQCQVGKCTGQYQIARQDLNITDDSDDKQAICTALRTYRHCISKIVVGCSGDLEYFSIRNIVSNKMKKNKCNKTGSIVEPSKNKNWRPDVPDMCKFQGKKSFKHCGLFGDPHLRTFNGDFQTCRVKGAWPLVNNDFLIVQVTNDPVEGNPDATATSKLTVIVKGNSICTSENFQTYQAQTNYLPGAFEDGHVTYGPFGSLELVEVDPGKHVEIHIRYIDTIVVIRQIGHYFTFSIKMPEELINSPKVTNNLQLCDRGCPNSELINYQKYLADRKHSLSQGTGQSRKDAEEVCRKSKLVGFYFDSCVFDLMATGDENFTLSAISSLQDVLKLQPSESKAIGNRTTLQNYDKQYSGGGGDGNGGVSSLRSASCEYSIIRLVLFLILTQLLVTRTCLFTLWSR